MESVAFSWGLVTRVSGRTLLSGENLFNVFILRTGFLFMLPITISSMLCIGRPGCACGVVSRVC